MKRGLKSGQKVKKNGEYYNHRFHTAFTDDQFDTLCDLAKKAVEAWNRRADEDKAFIPEGYTPAKIGDKNHE